MWVIFFRTIIIYITMTVLLRLMGKRQVGELECSELISTLLLSDIATLPIANPDIPLLYAILPIILIVGFEIIITYSKNKLNFLKRIFESKPSFLIYKGKIDQGEMEKMRISIEELVSELRVQEINDINDVYYAILEENGKLSVIKKAELSPPSAQDLGIPVPEKGIAHPVIIDGAFNYECIERIGKTEKEIQKLCKERKCNAPDVFMMTIDDDNNIKITMKEKKK